MSNLFKLIEVCVVWLWYNGFGGAFPMKLSYDRRSKDPTYFAQVGYRDANGKSTTRNVKRYGKHSELLKITDDPIAYVKADIKKMNEELKVGKLHETFTVDFNNRLDSSDDSISSSTCRNIGYLYLLAVYQKLEISKFFEQITSDSKVSFDCSDINAFLNFSRILCPSSKLEFVHTVNQFFGAPDIDHQHVLRFMDILHEHTNEYIEWLFRKSSNLVERDTAVMYYDCTNFYCEAETPDEDYTDPVTGEIITGLRQYGVSKEHRPNPIVEMGLFMDRRGIPVSMCIHPGNKSEQLTAVPLEKEILKMTEGKKFIYCADAGLSSYSIRQFNSMNGRAFVVTQSIKKMSEPLQQAVFNDTDYHLLSDGKTPMTIAQMKSFDPKDNANRDLYNDMIFKVITADKAVDTGLYELVPLKNGKTRKQKVTGNLHQRIIITFSRKLFEYQRTIRSRQIERAKKTLEMKDPEEIKKGNNDVKRFLKRIAKGKDGEDAVVTYVIDEKKIAEEEKYDGFYAVATNLEDSAKEVLAISHQRYKIEECFRIMKTNFEGRPYYHSTPERIRTHFVLCYSALLIYRLLECQLDDNNLHLTTKQMIDTMKNMTVVDINGMFYHSAYTDSQALQALEKIYPLTLNCKDYLPKDLRKIAQKLRR